MPYTPPSQNSPASSKSVSPSVSRSSSYCEDGPLRSPITGRPALPRSMSSASYLNRHRRTPSISSHQHAEQFQAPPTPTEYSNQGVEATDFAPSASLRQSPPPVNNLIIPTGAIISPPDSSENSDGDDSNDSSSQDQIRGRALEIRKLQDAVRVIDLKREPSPENSFRVVHINGAESEPTSQAVSPSALSASARKISHSRSATETAIVIPRQASFAVSPTQTSDESDDEDGLHSKPALVRKKSGELVKPALRPSSRRRYSSMPGTPTYSKSVHFNDNDNQTRHFLQVDKPIAVSAGSSPVEVYESEAEYPFDDKSKSKSRRDIKLANFPENTYERQLQPVRVERIFLSSDKQTLIGTAAVQNLSFHKLVVARFTLDYWKTTSEVVAEYHNDPRTPNADGCDRFNFHIKLSDAANIDEKTLLLCVRYAVDGQEYWDNNNNINYQIDFIKAPAKRVAKIKVPVQENNRSQSAIPRSRHSPPTTSHGRGRQSSVDDEFDSSFDSSYHFGTPEAFVGETSTIKLKPKTKSVHTAQATGNNLGGRYDFGASLSAALTHAQEKLGRSSGLLGAHEPKSGGSYFGPQDRKEGPSASTNDKPNLGMDRPAMGSDQYRDLVQKFCYFTPSGATKGVSSPQPAVAAAPKAKINDAQVDGPVDNAVAPTVISLTRSSSSCSTPASLDGTYELPISPLMAQYISGAATPSSQGCTPPLGLTVPFYTTGHDAYFNEASHHQATAIQG